MGLFTIVRLLRAVAGRDDGALFWRVKRGRPSWSKLPMFTRPGPALRLADFSVVHPEFRHLGKREAFAALWAHGAPLHVVVPVRQPLRLVPDSFITHPADLTAQAASSPSAGDRVVAVATASSPSSTPRLHLRRWVAASPAAAPATWRRSARPRRRRVRRPAVDPLTRPAHLDRQHGRCRC